MESNEPRNTKRQGGFIAKLKNVKWDYWLIAILILAAFLYAWNIWESTEANNFYTSAIVSMTQSFKNFWYASFDPAGYITVDKPPVALWFMAISAKIFGVHGWSVVLPSILFAIGSVYLIYALIKNRFGRIPARIAALIMTITPIAVADSRTNNMDATLIFFLLLSVWFVQKAVFKGQQRYLWIGFSLMGIAFNVKMLQAFMILPALYFYYWIATKINWKKKLAHLGIASLFLIVFTLIWPLSVDMTNPNNRPYEGGSETNSALELAFGYNGTQRLMGQTTGTGGAFPGMGNNKKSSKTSMGTPPGGTSSKKGSQGTPPAMPGGSKSSKNSQGGPGGPGNSKKGGGGGAFNTGNKGPFRLFGQELGPQISWLLIVAILGFFSSFFYYRGSKMKRWYSLTPQRKELWLWAGWLVPVFGFFSVAGFFHPYYTIMLAPAIATLGGVGIYSMFKQWRHKSVWSLMLPTAILSTSLLQAWYMYEYYPVLSWILAGLGTLASIAMYVIPWMSKKLIENKTLPIAGVILIMLAPTWWSLTPTISGESSGMPTAGPDLLSNPGSSGGGIGSGSTNSKLLSYLEKHQGNAKYLFATDDSSTAAPYIIKTGKAVMAMGGFNGTDQAITLAQFKKMVKSGEVKYYYSGGKTGSANTKIVNWIKKNAKKVTIKGLSTTSVTSSSSETSQMGGAPGQGGQGGPGQGGTPPTGTKPSGVKPSGTKAPSSSTIKKPSNSKGGMPGGGMGGPGGSSSGTLYDLSSIYK
ncbi:glycosyltransferase family 39 protein [Companilactobacillus ginsenosidimutans]|uniref:4-amino-4-deoxy-L-arabinose transferase n=1 Tax=Companilactobacillus ginsenosidimutans TaxID=1007676 RepID=A0A0H4QID4_9LACO|nr:glycosyltransferase family 39 protein [Companilactobacillus ginsenosidimutans]AKP66801.1 4-amino-4-deoxy-L-arabinose transferase [Companilactobacillus ginsenosidimutans]